MPIISIFAGAFCNAEEVVHKLAAGYGAQVVTDQDVVFRATKLFGILKEDALAILEGKPDYVRRCKSGSCLWWIKLTLAEYLKEEKLVYHGFFGMLLPNEITHVLKVCLIADSEYRRKNASEFYGIQEDGALSMVHLADHSAFTLCNFFLDRHPWDYDLYDILIPMNRNTPDEAAEIIIDYADKDILKATPKSLSAVEDFKLKAQVESALGELGLGVQVQVRDGAVKFLINRKVFLLKTFMGKLKKIASAIPGVESVECERGPYFFEAPLSRRMGYIEAHPNVFLLGREEEFESSLSERLSLTEKSQAVFIEDKDAFSYTGKAPVIVLDLKDPHIDRRAALSTLKTNLPDARIIVMAAHGSSEDEMEFKKLGAFGFIQKPANIFKLGHLIEKAKKEGSNS